MFIACSFALTAAMSARAEDAIRSQTATLDGIELHYLTTGQGAPVILLHGYTQTSRMWRPLMPRLAKSCRVIAPDLPGIGDSGIPADGLDMTSAAVRIHALVKSLGIGPSGLTQRKESDR